MAMEEEWRLSRLWWERERVGVRADGVECLRIWMRGCTAKCAQGARSRNISTHDAVYYAYMDAGIGDTAGGHQ